MRPRSGPTRQILRMLFINHRSFAGGVENEIGIVVSGFEENRRDVIAVAATMSRHVTCAWEPN